MTALGLTKPELAGVKRTWALVETNLEAHGIGILQALFERYPAYKAMFKTFKGTDDKDAAFCKHAKTFIKSLQQLVKNLENKESLVKLLHANANSHYAKKITISHYQNTLELVPVYLKDKLGSELDDVAAAGWKKVLEAIETEITARLKELQKKGK